MMIMRCSAGLSVDLISQTRDGFPRKHTSFHPKLRSSGQTALHEPGQWHALSGLQQQEQTAQEEEGKGHEVMGSCSEEGALCQIILHFSPFFWPPNVFIYSKTFFHYQYLSCAIVLCSLGMKRPIKMT